jgi:import inner membrane translocase subunit TIM22
MGIFMGAMSDPSPIVVLKGREVPQAPLREQVRSAYKATAFKSYGWAKSFGILTALFGGVECVIEKYRAKHDVWNPVISGCAVGATLSAKSGPAVSKLEIFQKQASEINTYIIFVYRLRVQVVLGLLDFHI